MLKINISMNTLRERNINYFSFQYENGDQVKMKKFSKLSRSENEIAK